MKLDERIRNLSLKTKIILITVIISIIPVIILAMSASKILFSGVMDQKSSNAITNLRSINQSINAIVNMRRIPALRFGRSVDAIALAHPEEYSQDEREQHIYTLERFLSEYLNTKGVRSIAVYYESGAFYSSVSNEAFRPQYERRLEICRAKKIIEPWWSSIECDGDNSYLPYNVPILTPFEQKLIGIITINFQESELQTSYSYYNNDDDLILLTDSSGNVISAADPGRIMQPINTILRDAGAFENIKAERAFICDYNGEEVYVSSLRNTSNDIYIVDISSLETLAAARTQIGTTFIVAIVCSIAIVLLLAIFLSNNLTKPVNELVRSIQSMQPDAPAKALAYRYRNEFGIIGEALDEMVAKLQNAAVQMQQEQRAKREAELRTLLMQINPHFLYNTLSSVIWMIQTGKKEESIELITALSALFKIGVNKGQEEISISDELAYIENYLRIQKIRYGSEFDYAIACPEELKAYRTVKLLLQPLVENAIYHGIDVADDAFGHITVSVSAAEDCLLMQVSNSPSLLTEQDVLHINNCLAGEIEDKSFGIGLNNVNARVRLAYGNRYGVFFSVENKWTVVTVRIPMRLDAQGYEV